MAPRGRHSATGASVLAFRGGPAAIRLVTTGRRDLVLAAVGGLEAQPTRAGVLGLQCPSCGGKLQVPDRAAALSCPFCRVPLLASHGMLARWAEDAEERRLEWLARANDLLDRVRARETRAAQRAPVVISVAAIGLALSSGGAASLALSNLKLTRVAIVCRGVCRVDGMTCLKGGEITIYLAPGETKVVDLWVAPKTWKSERVTVPQGERRVFVCPPTPDAPTNGGI